MIRNWCFCHNFFVIHEDRWIGHAIQSVLDFIYKPEIFTDNGSDDCPDQFEDGNDGCQSTENLGADQCPDQFEDGNGGCFEFVPSSYIEGTDPNGDNDHNGDNYDCGTDGREVGSFISLRFH